MAEYDSEVAKEKGLPFLEVNVNDADIYKKYRHILLHQFPMKRELKYPTYLLVENPQGDFVVQGEIVGSCSREEFSDRLDSLRTASKA